MRGGWAATILAIVMAIIGIVLTIGGAWLVALGGSLLLSHRRRRDAGVGLVPVPWPAARRVDLCRAVHPDSDLGFRGIAWQRLGDGAVAGCAAGDPHLDPACDADADAARAQALGLPHGGRSLLRSSLSPRASPSSARRAARRSPRCRRKTRPASPILRASPPAPTGRPMAAPTPRGASRR